MGCSVAQIDFSKCNTANLVGVQYIYCMIFKRLKAVYSVMKESWPWKEIVIVV